MNDDLIKYNDDETVNVPFGRVAEWYISKHPLLKNIKLKCQSRKKTPELVKENIITVDRVEGAVDYIEWRTNKGETKSTNRIDDIVHLTPMGEEYVKEIEAGKRKDRLCWSWTMYCAGGNSCQRECGNIGSCKENCANRNFPNNIKNSHDMHLCKVRVISESKLSWLKTSKPLRIKIIGSHLPANALNTHIPNSSKLNLTREIRDKIILNRRSDYKTVKEIKMTLLAPYNGANEETLRNVLNEQREICNDTKLRGFIKRDDRRLKENSGSWTILHYLVTEILKLKGYVLYYQQPDPLAPEDHPDHYYQLTLSNDLWLKNGQKFGNFCIGLDGKYDLNNDHAPILTMIVENNTGCATPLAFGLSNKENNWTIRLAIQAIKQNIPCSRSECNHEWYYQDLPSGKGFERISNCANIQLWNPLAMIDKHRPSRIAIQSLLRGSILCWFHIMKTIGENFSQWNIPWSIRYPLAIAFKIVGRSRSVKQCEELAIEYKKFINSLDLANNVKQKIINDIYNNWISDEWILGFIDAGRLPQTLQDNPMTTNNFTERMNRSIETNHSGIKTVVNFVERLYGLKLNRENITERSGETSFEAGLSTLFDAQSIEQENQSKHISSDKLRRLNLGRLYFLMGYVKSSNNNNYFYVKKHNQLNVLESSYDGSFVKMDDNIIEKLYPLYQKFAKNHYSVVPELEGYYLTNIFSGECLICLDYIWNGSFRDVCKHCHAARIYKESLNAENLFDYSQEVKNQLVTYFKNKERVISAENKNKLIYEGDTHVAYNEILRLFELQGTKIFWPDNKPLKLNRDPFRPELNNKRDFNAIGAPPKPSAKPRKPSRILCNSILEEDKENKETFSTQQRKTKRTRRQIRTYKENTKDNGNNKNNENNLGPSVPDVNLPASYNIKFDLNPSFNSQPTLQPTLYNIPYYTNTNTSLPTSIYSQSTFSSTNAIPNSNYTSFNIPQDQLAYSYPSIPNDLGQFSYNNQIELSNSYSYSFNQAPDNNFSDNNTFSQKHF